MHFDDSVENIADSDLEDGELQKMLTSPLYAQKSSGKPDAMVVQEREVSSRYNQAKRKESLRFRSSEGQKASGKRDGSLNNCFSELHQQAYAQRLELQDAQH